MQPRQTTDAAAEEKERPLPLLEAAAACCCCCCCHRSLPASVFVFVFIGHRFRKACHLTVYRDLGRGQPQGPVLGPP